MGQVFWNGDLVGKLFQDLRSRRIRDRFHGDAVAIVQPDGQRGVGEGCCGMKGIKQWWVTILNSVNTEQWANLSHHSNPTNRWHDRWRRWRMKLKRWSSSLWMSSTRLWRIFGETIEASRRASRGFCGSPSGREARMSGIESCRRCEGLARSPGDGETERVSCNQGWSNVARRNC